MTQRPNGAYSSLKAAWHTERIAAIRRGELPAPAQLQLVLSDLCNHDCSFCAYRMSGYTSNAWFSGPNGERNPNRMIPHEKAEEILDDAHEIGVSAIQFTGGGEPTVHPSHVQVFEHAQSLGLETSLVTNGHLLRDGWEDPYSEMSWIRVSLDAGTAATYAKVRRVHESVFDKVLSHVSRISEVSKGELGVSFVVTRENIEEIPLAAQAASLFGADSIRFAACFTQHGSDYYEPGEIAAASASIQYARDQYESPSFKVIDMFGSRVDDLDAGSPPHKFCGYQLFNVYVGGDLNVYRCCNTAYNPKGLVGSIKDRRLSELWKDPTTHSIYYGFDARSCERCAFNPQNALIHQLTQEKPLHVNFV